MSGLIGEQSISNGFNIISRCVKRSDWRALYLIKISPRYPHTRNLSLATFFSFAQSSKFPKSSHRNNEIPPFRANFKLIFSSFFPLPLPPLSFSVSSPPPPPLYFVFSFSVRFIFSAIFFLSSVNDREEITAKTRRRTKANGVKSLVKIPIVIGL